jgi:M6 family metalloprotease-like protein
MCREESAKRQWSIRIRAAAVFCALSVTVLPVALALEPPRPGEIERLRQAGTLEQSLEAAKNLGNDRIDPVLVERMKHKIAQIRGSELLAPPPAWAGMPTTGNVRIFALLIEFQDYPHTVAAATVDSMLFGAGNPADFPVESLTSYYHRSSYGLLDLGDGATLGWYQAPYDRSAVVEDDLGRDNLIKEALDSFDLTHDFSVYDNNSDGAIDYFVVMWTGPTGPWASFWWGYLTGFSDVGYLLDGKKLGMYSWQWEASAPTVVIHETGHALGLPDYYDYDDTVGPDGGVGGFDMMDRNRYDHNSFSKWMLDWLTPSVVTGADQIRTLNPLSQQPEALLAWPCGDLGNPFSEYFLVENRQSVANDDTGFLPDGLAIWHVDATLDAGGWNYAYNNSFTSHKLLRLMEADGLEQIEAGGGWSTDDRDLYNEGDRLSPVTHPSSIRYDGTHSFVTVGGIIDLGDDAPMTASVSATGACVRYDSHGGLTEIYGNGNEVVDPGETWDLSVGLRNDGPVPASGVSADLTVDPATPGSVFLLQSHSSYGTIDSGQVVSSLYRFRLGDDFPCGSDVVLSVSGVTSIDPAGSHPDAVAVIRIPVGESVILFEDDFETNKGWQRPYPVLDEWQLAVPQGLGAPDPDPVTGYDGPTVMGTDLTGFGLEPGNYPTGRVAQIRTPDIAIPAGSVATEVEYARWLNVEPFGDYGRVGVAVPGGGRWFPDIVTSGVSTWTIDRLDIRDVTAGKDRLVVWFTLASDAQGTNSGWNIDAFKVHGRSCEPHSPTALPGEATRLKVDKAAPGQLLLSWDADCGSAQGYSVYRGDLGLGYGSLAPEPGLCDVSSTSVAVPEGPGDADFFLVVPFGDSHEGSYGAGSDGLRVPTAGACRPPSEVAVCAFECQIATSASGWGLGATAPDGVGQSFTACKSATIRAIRIDVMSLDDPEARIELQTGSSSWPGSYSQGIVLTPGENVIQLAVPFEVESGVEYSFGLFPSTGALNLRAATSYAGGAAFFIVGSTPVETPDDLRFEMTIGN